MPHIADGRLHAYLDGALGREEPEREELEGHLAVCADCRARLDEARRVRASVDEILARATPPAIERPGFGDLVRRAEARAEPGAGAHGPEDDARRAAVSRRRRSAAAAWRLAWAASVVLAVGAGWMGHRLTQERSVVSRPSPDPVSAAATRPASESSGDERLAELEAAGQRSGDPRLEAERAAQDRPGERAREADHGAPGSGAEAVIGLEAAVQGAAERRVEPTDLMAKAEQERGPGAATPNEEPSDRVVSPPGQIAAAPAGRGTVGEAARAGREDRLLEQLVDGVLPSSETPIQDSELAGCYVVERGEAAKGPTPERLHLTTERHPTTQRTAYQARAYGASAGADGNGDHLLWIPLGRDSAVVGGRVAAGTLTLRLARSDGLLLGRAWVVEEGQAGGGYEAGAAVQLRPTRCPAE